jgi:ribonuclease P protein component
MTPAFRQLFAFTNPEVTAAFAHARRAGKTYGLTLLHSEDTTIQGKILIITPRASGKANERNLIRRRVKHIFYTNKLYETSGRWILLVYRQAHRLSYQDLTAFLTHAIRPTTCL